MTPRLAACAGHVSVVVRETTGLRSCLALGASYGNLSADESGLERVGHRACAVSHVELDVDTVEIALDCRRRYGKLFGNLRAGAGIGGELKDTKLSC